MHAVYDEIPDVLDDLGLDAVDAVLFDLGVSSLQLDVVERGFAYREDAPLDMRMDGTDRSDRRRRPQHLPGRRPGPGAQGVRRGEVRPPDRHAPWSKARETPPFTTSARLVELLYDVIPAPARRTGGHPAKRTFQALRMEVNEELAVLRRALPAAIDAIAVGGRVVVESYHSLEDRLVKRAFADATRSDVPDDLPVRARRPRAGLPPGHPRRRAGRRRRGRPQPARRQRPAARPRTTHPFPAPRSRIGHEQPRLPDQVRPDPRRRTPGRVSGLAGAALERARLTVVPRTRTRTSPLPFVTLVSFVLLAGVIGLLMFNTSMQQAAFTATTMEQQAATLNAREQTLRMELDVLRDPQRVALKAQRMGMVIPATPAFLRLADGKVLGTPTPATREDGLRLLPKAPKKPAVLDPAPNVVTVVAEPPTAGRPRRGIGQEQAPGR